MMERRTRKCAEAGFDAIEYDVVAAHESGRKVTGWDVSYADQLAYNRGLARLAHRHGLAVGLKNDLSQVEDLIGRFDFAINEECFTYHECELLSPSSMRANRCSTSSTPTPAASCDDRGPRLQFDQEGRQLRPAPEPYRPCS